MSGRSSRPISAGPAPASAGKSARLWTPTCARTTSKPLRGKLKQVYGEDETIKALDDKSLAELGENLRRGVPIATPVFDGAREKDIVEMLKARQLRSVRAGDAL